MQTKFSPKDYTVLLVEDDQDQLLYYTDFLEEQGYKVFSANTPREALILMRRNSVDVIVSDLKMPGADGVEFIEYLRKTHMDTPNNVLRIVMFTSSHVMSESTALALGADRFCEKKNYQRDLLDQIRSLIERPVKIKES